MAAVIRITVETSGGLDSVKKDLDDLSSTAKDSGGGFNALQEIAAGAMAAIGEAVTGLAIKGFQMLGNAIRDGIADAKQNAQIQAQTAQVLKSTGNAAGKTTEQIAAYASSLSDAAGQSLFGDDQIQQSTNLLLTFTNIKDKTLDAATAISVDMAQALGGAPKDAAIQLGKALNDPVKGITALTRVGVTFSDEQKAQIQAMQEAGDTAGAQAVILAELNKEFGGSAAAAAAATGGWSEFNGRMGEAKEALGAAVLPLLNSLSGVLNSTILPIVEIAAATFGTFVNSIMSATDPLQEIINQIDIFSPTIGTIVAAIADFITSGGDLGLVADDLNEGFSGLGTTLLSVIQPLIATFSDAKTPVEGFLNVLSQISPMFAVVRGIVEAALPPIQSIVMSVFGIISGFLSEHGAKIKADIGGAWQQIQALIQAILPPIQAIVSAVFGAIATFLAAHGTEIKAFMAQTWDTIATIVKTVLAILQAIVPPVLAAIAGFIQAHGTEIQAILNAAWTVISTIISTVLNTIKGVVTAVMQAINGDWSGAWETIKQTCAGIVQALITIITTNLDLIKTLFGGMVDDVIATLNGLADQAIALGANIINGIISGVENGIGALESAVKGAAQNALDAAKNALGISSPSDEFAQQVGQPIILGIIGGIQDMVPELGGVIQTVMESLVAGTKKMTEAAQEEIDKTITDLQKKAEDIGTSINGAIADAFSGTASFDRLKAKAIGALKDISDAQQASVQEQLNAADAAASAMTDPQQAAKYFKMRSDQIFEIAKLQDQISKATDAGARARLEGQLALIQQAQAAESSAASASASASMSSPLAKLTASVQAFLGSGGMPGLLDSPALNTLNTLLAQLQAVSVPVARLPVGDVAGGSTSTSTTFNYAPSISTTGGVSTAQDYATARALAGGGI